MNFVSGHRKNSKKKKFRISMVTFSFFLSLLQSSPKSPKTESYRLIDEDDMNMKMNDLKITGIYTDIYDIERKKIQQNY